MPEEEQRPETYSSQSISSGIGVLACVDLFFVTRICDTARELGLTVRSCSNREQLAELHSKQKVSALFIDLSSMSETLEDLPRLRQIASQLTIIAFGSHVQTDLLKTAREAGCDQVLSRSRFTTELVNLLQKHLGEPSQ